jgi:hypothetical protein
MNKHSIYKRGMNPNSRNGFKPRNNIINTGRTRFKKGIIKERCPAWKGGIYKSNGYTLEYCPKHPFANKRGYVMQHRLIMEKYIKRFLLPIEIVHHINEITDDNRIENLQLLSGRKEHSIYHKKRHHGF